MNFDRNRFARLEAERKQLLADFKEQWEMLERGRRRLESLLDSSSRTLSRSEDLLGRPVYGEPPRVMSGKGSNRRKRLLSLGFVN